MGEIATRERILEAATALVRERGPQGASARAICERAGIKAPALYHHFGDMGRLREAVVERAFAEALRRKGSGRAADGGGDDPLADIRRGWDAYVAFAVEEPALFAVIGQQVTSGALPEPARRSYENLLADVRRLAGQAGRLRVGADTAAQMLWAAAHGTACLLAAGSSGFAAAPGLSDSLREATIGFVLGGARPSGAG